MTRCPSTAAAGRSVSQTCIGSTPVTARIRAAATATAHSGYSRNNRPIQNPATLPRRSSDAGITYPLTRKNTMTP